MAPKNEIKRKGATDSQDWSSPQEHLGRKEEETSAPSHPSPLPALCTRSPQFFPAVPLLTPLFSTQVNVRTISSNLSYIPTQALASSGDSVLSNNLSSPSLYNFPPPAQEFKQTKLTNRPITRPGPQNAPHLLQRQRVQKAHPAQSHTVQSRQGTPSPVPLPPASPKNPQLYPIHHQTLKHK